MKKEYLIGLLTGCLLTFSVLVFMGATDDDSDVGQYQAIYCGASNDAYKVPIVRMINTSTGQMYEYGAIKKKWKIKGKPVQD